MRCLLSFFFFERKVVMLLSQLTCRIFFFHFLLFWPCTLVTVAFIGRFLYNCYLWSLSLTFKNYINNNLKFLCCSLFSASFLSEIYCILKCHIFAYQCWWYKQGAFLEKIRSENPGIPCFLFGHSTGGAVVLKVSLKSSLHLSL